MSGPSLDRLQTLKLWGDKPYVLYPDFLAGASSGLLLHITYDTQICTYTIIYILIRVILEWLYTYTCEFTFTQSFLRLCWNWPRTSWRNWSYEHLFTSLNNRQPQTVLYWEGIRTYRCPRTAPHPILGSQNMIFWDVVGKWWKLQRLSATMIDAYILFGAVGCALQAVEVVCIRYWINDTLCAWGMPQNMQKKIYKKWWKKTDDEPLDVHFVPCSTVLGKPIWIQIRICFWWPVWWPCLPPTAGLLRAYTTKMEKFAWIEVPPFVTENSISLNTHGYSKQTNHLRLSWPAQFPMQAIV